MVYNDLDYLGKNDEEDGEEGQGQPVSPVTSGQPGAVNPAAPQSQAPQQERKGSGKFTNIKKYVDANQSASQKLGEGIQKKIGSEAENVRKGIESAQGQFQQGAQQTQQILDKGTGYAQQVGQVGGAQQIANVEPEFQTFRDIYTGQVKGPDETISSQQQNAAKLQALSQLAGNEAGRFQLLDQTYTNPTQAYTRGQKRFDQLLLQATPDVTKNLQQFGQQQATDVSGKYSQAEKAQAAEMQRLKDLGLTQKEALTSAAGQYTPETDEEGNTTYGTGALGGLYSQLAQAQKQAGEQQSADVENVRQALERFKYPTDPGVSGKVGAGAGSFLTKEQANLLNLDPNTRTYDLDLGQFAEGVKASDQDITMAEVADQEQQARLNALYRLTGQDPSSINLGEVSGRRGAEFGQDFEGARGLAENKWLDKAINDYKNVFGVDKSFQGNFGNAQNVADIFGYEDLRGDRIAPALDPALAKFREALSSTGNQDVDFRSALSGAYKQGLGVAGLSAGERLIQDIVKQLESPDKVAGDGVARENYALRGYQTPGGTQYTGRTLQEYIQDLINRSRTTVTGE